jgi:putative transposase
MTRRRHTPGQILEKLRDMEVLQAEGHSIGEIAKRFEVSEQTLHRWRNQFGGMKGEEMKRLKELERENARLKRLVADLALDNRMLKDLAEGNF